MTALDWLEKAYAEGRWNAGAAQGAPAARWLRGEPRFRDLLARMRLDS
jgi:hypothetical protein